MLLHDAADNVQAPAWSPDGATILYSVIAGATPGIHALPVSDNPAVGGTVVRLTEDADDAPCWSPDGSTIAFVWTTSSEGPRIYTMTAAGTHDEEIPGQEMGNDQPCWK